MSERMDRRRNNNTSQEDDSSSSSSSSTSTPSVQIRTFTKRYLIIFILYSVFFITWYQVSQYTALTKTIAAYYHVSDVAVTMTAVVFTLIYALLAFPLSFITERIGIKNSFVWGTFFTSFGACIKCFSIEPNHFWIIVVGQTTCAVGQVFVFGTGAAVAAIWFDSHSVATVNAMAYGVTCISPAVNFLLQGLMFGKGANVGLELTHLCISVALATTVVFLITVAFMEEAPPVPPSFAQLSKLNSQNQENLRVKDLLLSRNYLLIVLAFSISQLVGNTLSLGVNEMVLTVMPDGYLVLSIVGILMSLGGGISSYFFGTLLDRTKLFKDIAVVTYILTLLALALFLFAFWDESLTMLYIGSALVGITFNGFGAVAFDVMIELTYPFPETKSAGIMLCISAALATPSPLVCTYLFSTIGILNTVLILIGILCLGLATVFSIKWDLKRQAAEERRKKELSGAITHNIVNYDDCERLLEA